VRDGVLHHDGGGGNLISTREFGDFELLVDWKIEPGGDSGIYLRGKPQVQIWDDPSGSGGLFNNKSHPSKPAVRADRPVGEWNTFRIVMVGSAVTVYLNGTLVVDRIVMENYPDYRWPVPSHGPIELQHFRSHLQFRNIFVRELGAATSPVPNGPVGRWVELRPGTPAGDRVRTFQADGTLIFQTVRDKQTTVGTWRREGERIYLRHSARDADEKWFTISAQDAGTMTILMMGARRYVWYKSS
jgi:hypothetical protein